MIQFNKEFRKILEDVQITSPHPRIYTLERTSNGLYKRTYHHDGLVGYYKDREGLIPHRLDGPALSRPGYKGFFIEGQLYSEKDYWNAVKLKKPSDFDAMKDLLDI